MSHQDDYKTIEIFAGNIIEAGMIQQLLAGQGIAAEFKDEFLGMLAPWVASPGGAGAVKVMVSPKDAATASEIIRNRSFKDPQ